MATVTVRALVTTIIVWGVPLVELFPLTPEVGDELRLHNAARQVSRP